MNMSKSNWLHKGDRCIVTYVDAYDAMDGVDVGMLGIVQQDEDPCPYVTFPELGSIRVPLYQEQLRAVTHEDLVAIEAIATPKPQPIRAVAIKEADFLAVLTKYVKDELGIDAEVERINGAFEDALTLVLKDAA